MLDFYRFRYFEKSPQLLHAVTTKSTAFPYDFSLALHTGENPKDIITNRKVLAHTMETDKKLHFIVANQTHSDNIYLIGKEQNKGWEGLSDAVEACDALITDVPNVILTILTADCVPILLFDCKKRVVAAIHAGWRGTVAKITQKTVEKMKTVYGSNTEDIYAGIAPSIGQCCYEVGEDVAQHFTTIPHTYKSKENKYMLDLPTINKQQLLACGLKEEHIEMSNICTACEVERFFSYRKEQGCSGRFMSMIGLITPPSNT